MYKKLAVLDPTEHADLCLLPVTNYSFAQDQLVAPIIIDELADVAREYPIVFPQGSPLPTALMGVERASNAYVAPDGRWLARYIPAHIRHYPFALARVPRKDDDAAVKRKDDQMVVLVDLESTAVSRSQGQALFGPDGKPSPTLGPRVRRLNHMRRRAKVTQGLVKAIEDAGLLTEQVIKVRRAGETDLQVKGVRLIDEAALNKLDDEAFNSLRKSGALPLIYASLLSWANFRQGPIGRSHPLPDAAPVLEGDVIRFG